MFVHLVEAHLGRATRIACVCACSLSLTGCDLLANIIAKLQNTPNVDARISGAPYFKLSKKDKKDHFAATSGYLCVVHDPGCGSIGNDGTDVFFNNAILPPLVTLKSVEFTPIAPPNVSGDPGHGFIDDFGSYNVKIEPGPLDASKPINVRWHNSCFGTYGSQPLVYRISFVVSKKKGSAVDGEAGPDPATTAPPECAGLLGVTYPTPPSAATTQPTGFSGGVKVCNPASSAATVTIVATVSVPNPGASGKTMMNETINVHFATPVNGTALAAFSTQRIYEPGSWTISWIIVNGVTKAIKGINAQMPGDAGSPMIDFTGGSCSIP